MRKDAILIGNESIAILEKQIQLMSSRRGDVIKSQQMAQGLLGYPPPVGYDMVEMTKTIITTIRAIVTKLQLNYSTKSKDELLILCNELITTIMIMGIAFLKEIYDSDFF
ncbi:MAG: hypothetical protein H7843_04000 [Nitrospirota bacterium]